MRHIGFLGYDGITALDLAGPMQVFQAANDVAALTGQPKPYVLLVLGLTAKLFVAEAGLRMMPDFATRRAPKLDTIVVPGGEGVRRAEILAPAAAWLKARAKTTRRIASVCTGIYGLAEAGLLDGRRATTHWRFAADVARRYPRIRLEPDAIYLRDGPIYTSAGVTAGIDLALALVEDDLGGRLALAAARELVVYLKRSGGQTQFSEPLKFQTRATDRFADLASWMLRNLDRELSVEALAARAGMGVRHFNRRFRATFGVPPGEYVERLRLDEARRRLPSQNQTVESVATSVGYASADAFRRAFERRFGIAPSHYRKRFAA